MVIRSMMVDSQQNLVVMRQSILNWSSDSVQVPDTLTITAICKLCNMFESKAREC